MWLAPPQVPSRTCERRLRLAGAGQHPRSGAHAAADQHRLAGLCVFGRQFGMSRPEGACRALAMDEEPPRPSVDDMRFLLAGIVRDVIEQRQRCAPKDLGKRLPRKVGENLAVGKRAVDAGAHRAEIAYSQGRLQRRAGEFPVGQVDAGGGCRDGHLAQVIGADLVAETARATVDAHHHVVRRQAIGARRGGVEDGFDDLDFEIVVAGTERSHLVALALLRLLGNRAGIGACDAAVLLDAREVGRTAEALLDGPARTAFEHRIHSVRIETQAAGAADPDGNARKQEIGQRLLFALDVGALEAGMQRAHAAGNVEPHAVARRRWPVMRTAKRENSRRRVAIS